MTENNDDTTNEGKELPQWVETAPGMWVMKGEIDHEEALELMRQKHKETRNSSFVHD